MSFVDDDKIDITPCNDEIEDYSIKIVIVGDSNVGKTNILNRFVSNDFSADSRATVGVELSSKSYKINGKIIKLHLWDTAGQERFKSITSSYYKGAKGAMIVYDITNKESFLHLDKWIKEVRDNGGKNINVVICGNKSDLELKRVVSTEEGMNLAKQNDIMFFETSALNSFNIEEAFQLLIKEVYSVAIKATIKAEKEENFFHGNSTKIDSSSSPGSKKKKCC